MKSAPRSKTLGARYARPPATLKGCLPTKPGNYLTLCSSMTKCNVALGGTFFPAPRFP
jgi:hypothetical protein